MWEVIFCISWVYFSIMRYHSLRRFPVPLVSTGIYIYSLEEGPPLGEDSECFSFATAMQALSPGCSVQSLGPCLHLENTSVREAAGRNIVPLPHVLKAHGVQFEGF